MKKVISKSLKLNWSYFSTENKNHNLSDNYLSLYQGRYAFYTALSILGLKKDDEVLLPAYHCLSMVEPILQYGCKINFYKVRSDLQTTVEDIDNAINDNTKAVILVHYFGLLQKNLELVKKYLGARNVYLVEDCAHIIPSVHGKAGVVGDISIFSPRKFLPLIDGALLRINNNSDDLTMPDIKKMPLMKELKTVKNTFEQHLGIEKYNWIRKCYLRFDKVVNTSRNALKSEQKNEVASLSVIFDSSLINATSSHLASYIIRRAKFEDIYHRRTQIFQYLYNEMHSYSGWLEPEFLRACQGECVFGFPVLAKNKREVILELKRRNIQTFTFGEDLFRHPLRKEELVDRSLTQELFFIPVHQDLAYEDLEYIVHNLKDILTRS